MRLVSAFLCVGALLSLAPAPSVAPATPLPPPISLAGRDCGGTSKPAATTLAALPPTPSSGWSSARPVGASAVTLSQVSPVAAADGQGRMVVVWQETTARDGGDIVALPAGGQRAVRVDDTRNNAALQSRPTVALDPDGRIHVAWEDLRDSGASQIYYAMSADGGASWSANVNLTGGIPSRDHLEPALFSALDGSLVLAWRSNRRSEAGASDILAMRRSGDTWGAPVTLNAALAPGARLLPRLAHDGQGGVVAVWEDQRNSAPAVYSARLADPAGAWSGETLASPLRTAAARPSLAGASDGALYLAYQGDPGIFVQSSTDQGATWSPARRVDDGNGNKFTDPQVISDALGGIHCIWCQLQTNVVADIVTARSADGGATWGHRVALASSTGTANPLGLAADGRGRVHAFWADDRDDPTQRRIYSAVWQPEQLFVPLVVR